VAMTFFASTFPLLGEKKRKRFQSYSQRKETYVSIDARHFEGVENMHFMRRIALRKV
jgi:hypothetical protein